jgi:hypothetical protein
MIAGHVGEHCICFGDLPDMGYFFLRVLSLVFGVLSSFFVVIFSIGGKRIHQLFVVVTL